MESEDSKIFDYIEIIDDDDWSLLAIVPKVSSVQLEKKEAPNICCKQVLEKKRTLPLKYRTFCSQSKKQS